MAAHGMELLRLGRPLPTVGWSLRAKRSDGETVLLDPATGGELAPTADPAFVLSTDGEATDGNILRQFWDMERINSGAGVPLLWGHNTDRLLGQWHSFDVRELDPGVAATPAAPGRRATRGLVGRVRIDTKTADGAEKLRQIREGFISSTSVRWEPRWMVRRSELPPSDPDYRAPVEGDCGQPAEGYVMGDAAAPNLLLEGSLVTVPADARAVAVERLYVGASRAAGLILEGREPTQADMSRLLTALKNDERAIGFARKLIREEIAAARGGKISTGDPGADGFFSKFF